MHPLEKSHYSKLLNQDMKYSIFGTGGKIFLAFPSQDGTYDEFNLYGMVDCIESYITNKQCMIVCVDGYDRQSYDAFDLSEHQRITNATYYQQYILNELIPAIKKHYKKVTGKAYKDKIGLTGCSMGAYHALNFALNYPDTFQDIICLSGIYHAAFFFPNYQDTQIYFNSPIDLLTHLDINHPVVNKYRQLNLILCVGQGAWEDESLEDLKAVKAQCYRLAIPCWADIWGYDVEHHWYWWKKQLPYFMEHCLNHDH